jgi:uncharacterized protein YndB with AHSA1/START domain
MVEQIRQGDIPGVQLRCRHLLAAPVHEAWAWLTETERQSRWLADRIELESGPETALLLESGEPAGDSQRERLVSVTTDPTRKWVLDLQNLDGTWPVPTRVAFELTATPDGTEISVFQTGFAHLPLSECLTIWETYRRRWRTALTTLADLLASERP